VLAVVEVRKQILDGNSLSEEPRMTLRSRVMLAVLIPAFVGWSATPAQAQTGPTRTLEGYYSHYSFDTPDTRTDMNGFGARLMWTKAARSESETAARSRFAFGVFGEYAPNQNNLSFSVGHVGAEGDMNVLKAPLWGRLAPLVSLGAGVLWTNRVGPAIDEPEFALGDRSLAMFALTPAAGLDFALWRRVALRGDARDVVTFHDETLHHIQLAAGLNFTL